MKHVAQVWLIFFVGYAIYAHAHDTNAEAHELTKVLEFGRDAFGRKCIPLVFVSIFETLKVLTPVAVFCLVSSILTAFFISFLGKKSEFLVKIALDTLSSLPGFLIALSLGVLFSQSIGMLFIASIILIFPWLTRFLESHVMILKTKEYVDAARALGASPISIFKTHLFPELVQLIISVLPFLLTRLLLLETSLSFLGLGPATEHEGWGHLIYQGRDYLTEAPWILAAGGIPLCITLFSLHLVTREVRL